MTMTSPPRLTRPASHATDSDKSKTGRMRTARETKRNTKRRNETKRPRRDATDIRRPTDDITKTQGQNKETRRQDETQRREAYNETQKRDAATRRKARRKTKREDETERYILKADHWPRKSPSTFPTMREYNTNTRRRTTPPAGTHNMNTMNIRCRISNRRSYHRAKKMGVSPYIGDAPIPVGSASTTRLRHP